MGATSFVFGTILDNVTAILTLVSIVTGLCFSMAVTIWNKSIDARATPGLATDGYALTVLNDTRTHLVFTVMVGVLLAMTTVLFQTFSAADQMLARWGSAIIIGSTIYLMILVLQALGYFQKVFHTIKR